MKIQLSEHFTYPKLLRFVFPSIIMMIFTSIYGVVDGLFVSNYVGKISFAAINLIMPFLMEGLVCAPCHFLFCGKKQQSASFCQAKVGWQDFAESLYQWFFRVDDQFIYVGCKYAL